MSYFNPNNRTTPPPQVEGYSGPDRDNNPYGITYPLAPLLNEPRARTVPRPAGDEKTSLVPNPTSSENSDDIMESSLNGASQVLSDMVSLTSLNNKISPTSLTTTELSPTGLAGDEGEHIASKEHIIRHLDKTVLFIKNSGMENISQAKFERLCSKISQLKTGDDHNSNEEAQTKRLALFFLHPDKCAHLNENHKKEAGQLFDSLGQLTSGNN